MDAARRGDYAAAHRISDRVLAARAAPRDDPARPYHERQVWDGTLPDGRDTLVRCYHGLGDTIQFARFLPALRARASWLTVEAQPSLAPLLAPLADRVLAFDPAAPAPAAACTLEIMEAFHLLRATAADLAPAPYLSAGPAGLGLDAGLCWQGGDWDAARSVPACALAPLLAGTRRRWISLSPAAEPPPGVAPFPGGSLAATASLIAGLALVVTVDTMVAHLAGALGRPTLLLLRHDADWRWGFGDRTPWYPTMRMLRQSRPGDWADPVAFACERIEQANEPAG